MRVGNSRGISRREKFWESLWWWSYLRWMEEYLSAAEVARWCNVHYRTIENWKAQEKIESKDGKYGLKSAIAYRIGELVRELAEIKDNPLAELKQQKLAAEVEAQKAIARIKFLEAEQKEEKLVDAEAVSVAWVNYIQSCKAKLRSMPAKLANQLSGISDPEEIREILLFWINEALTELSE